MRRPSLPTLVTAAALSVAPPAAAQVIPSEPLVFGDGRVILGGEISATYGCADDGASGGRTCGEDTGFFNYTDYEHSTVRLFSAAISAAVHAGSRLSVLGEVRTENFQNTEPYALFARIRPWPERPFDIQVGRIPPTFGAFSRRRYPTDNVLIGYPLAYQYLTSIRADALPASADELLRMRGRGWLSSFSVGNRDPANGVPLISAFRWDTGVQAHTTAGWLDAAVSVTTGTLANPRVSDDNSGKQIALRLAVTPSVGFVIGASAARGPFVGSQALQATAIEAKTGALTQTALGADVEYSRGHYLLRGEVVLSDWRLPLVDAPALELPLRAVASSIEGRYRLRPGLYVAARLDHLGFSTIAGTNRTDEWDAPVTRLELGGGYSLIRNVLFKLSYQENTRDETRVSRVHVIAGQVVWWF